MNRALKYVQAVFSYTTGTPFSYSVSGFGVTATIPPSTINLTLTTIPLTTSGTNSITISVT